MERGPAKKYVITSSSQVKPHASPTDNLSAGAQARLRGARGAKGAKGKGTGGQGPAGPQGLKGETGPKGDTGRKCLPGPAGASGFAGAFYSVQDYTRDVGVGAIATAACDPNSDANSQNYVAILGGVQDTDSATDMISNGNQVSVAASFPGRMNWNTNTPKLYRPDGWIVQFSHAGTQDTISRCGRSASRSPTSAGASPSRQQLETTLRRLEGAASRRPLDGKLDRWPRRRRRRTSTT